MIDLYFILKKVPVKAPSVSGAGNKNGRDCYVFSSSLEGEKDLEKVALVFEGLPEVHTWSVDLDNWERVLRVECSGISPSSIKTALEEKKIYIDEMPV